MAKKYISDKFETTDGRDLDLTKQNILGYIAEDNSKKNIANGYAGLGSDGKLISSQLPSITISDTFVVGSQALMLALSGAEIGDVAVRTDLNKSFILKGTSYSTLADWQELLTPTSALTTVFGRNGAVTAQSGDYTTDQITETATRVFQTPTQKTNNDATSSIQTQLNNKQAVLTNPVTGTGTNNYITKWTGATTHGNSLIFDNGTSIGIGNTAPKAYTSLTNNSQFLSNGNIIANLAQSFRFNNYYNSGTSTDRAVSTGYAGDFILDNTNGSFKIRTTTSSFNADANINNVERLVITSSGNIGLGTATPNNKFTVSNGGASGFEFNPATGDFFTFNRITSLFTPMVFSALNYNFKQGAATFDSSVTATAHVTTGGTSSQYVKGDGSLSSTIPDSRPYKVYTALLTQSGTSAPVATVLENTLGGTVVWSYFGVGQYVGTLIGAFTTSKSTVTVTRPNPSATSFDTNIAANIINNDTMAYTTFNNTTYINSQSNGIFLEIRVYN
jgi:hypothetical protein